MKKLTAILLSIIMMTVFALPAFADTDTGEAADLSFLKDKFIDDKRDALSESDEAVLEEMLLNTLANEAYAGVIMISEDFSEITEEQAKAYCDEQAFSSSAGCVALVYSFNTNDFRIYCFSDDLGAFTDEAMLPYWEVEISTDYNSFNNGVYSPEAMLDACTLFCVELDDLANAAMDGHPFDVSYFSRANEVGDDVGGGVYDAGFINENETTRTIPDERLVPRLVDEADLLTDDEESKLMKKLDKISEDHEFDIIIVTRHSIGSKSSEQYADDYFDYNGCGFGSGHDGILFLISMENRDWAISTTGKGIPYFTDAGQAYMKDQFLPQLKSGNYNKAFNTFTDLCEDFVIQAEKGDPYDYGNLPRKPFSLIALGRLP